ncbi:MAG: hypothetical protein AAF684_05680, partial [Pseudomonadota bacterium]
MGVAAPNGGGPGFYCDHPQADAAAPWRSRFGLAPMADGLNPHDVLILTDVDDSTFGARLRIGGPLICSASTPVDRAPQVISLSRRRSALCAFCADTRTARSTGVDAEQISGPPMRKRAPKVESS